MNRSEIVIKLYAFNKKCGNKSLVFAEYPVLQNENDSLREQISAVNKELEITKEKLNTLEQAWDNSSRAGKLFIISLLLPDAVLQLRFSLLSS